MLAHFSHYLHNNQAPSEDETREIKALRVNPLEEISKIDVEIKRIESVLDSLKQKRTNFQKSVDDCNTILAPVRRLSMDVWGVIFTHCLATHRNPTMSATEAPILLTQICRDWRSTALSMPRLWSRLYIPILQRAIVDWPRCESLSSIHDGERRIEAYCEEVQRWLRLSDACPLSIVIKSPVNDSHQPLLAAILQSSRRWQQLELITSPESDISKKILSLSADDLCLLRELRVHSTLYEDSLWYQSGLFTAQGLRSISIGHLGRRNVFATGIPPNWKNLNHLFIHSPICLEFASQLLSLCCNLVACLLQIEPGGFSDAYITLSSCFLPHLKFLSLQRGAVGCSRLFSNIEAPSLRILDCHGEFPGENEGSSGLLNFLQSTNSLETLMVNCSNLTADEALRCYTCIPSLTRLVLGKPSISEDLHSSVLYDTHPEPVQLMMTLYKIRHQCSPDSAPTVLLPSLEVFEAYGIPNVTDVILLDFIKARIDAARSNIGVSKLKKVLVKFSRTRQTDIVLEALAYAKEAGVELELDLAYSAVYDQSWSPQYGLVLRDNMAVTWTFPSMHDY